MTVTPGKNWTGNETIDAAKLNATGTPVVSLGDNDVVDDNIEGMAFSKLLAGILNGTILLQLSGTGAFLQTDSFTPYVDETNRGDGVRLGNGQLIVNKGTWRGLIDAVGLKTQADGTVIIGSDTIKLKILPIGDLQVGTGGAKIVLVHDGRMFVGAVAYADAPFTVDAAGNLRLKNTAQSDHSIPISAIDTYIEQPVISPDGGAFDTAIDVAINTATAGARIYYTTDGSTPDASKTLYTGVPIHLTTAATIKAIAIKMGESSTVKSSVFTSNGASVTSNPALSPIPGSYTPTGGNLTTRLSCATPGVSIRYTTDGSTPTPSTGTLISPANTSTAPTATFVLTTGVRTVKAIAFKSGLSDSQVITGVYTITEGGSNTGGGSGGGGGGGGRGVLPY